MDNIELADWPLRRYSALVEDSQKLVIREIRTRDLGDREVIDAVEQGKAVFRVTRYGKLVGFFIPVTAVTQPPPEWFESHRDQT